MPKKEQTNTSENILENLISIAKLHWSLGLTDDMRPQLEQTARNINQIMEDTPDPEMEP
tara:strand:- start:485 stop:661 length:177 start_codon:yes stop_codon:yes gene_type:complete